MKIAIISDLHLGNGSITDHFGHHDSDFIRFLDYLESNFEKIILLGDIFETLMPKKFGEKKKEIESCFVAHRDIFSRFLTKKYEYIFGNHDLIGEEVLNGKEHLTINDKVNILFLHGHQFDPLISNFYWLSEIAVFGGGWISRAGLGPLYQNLAMSETKIVGKINNYFKQFEKTALNKYPKYDIVVTGHTHVGKIEYFNNQIFMNSGTCSMGQYSFLSIDTDKLEFKYNKSW